MNIYNRVKNERPVRTVNATRKSSKKTLSVPGILLSPFALPFTGSGVGDGEDTVEPRSRPRKNRTAPATLPVVYSNRPKVGKR